MVQLEDGMIYSFVSTRFRAVVELEDGTNRVVLHDFTGSPRQKWIAINSGKYWKFCNVGSGLYLGIDLRYSPSNGVEIIGTSNDEFLWKVEAKASTDHPTALRLFVPYTRFGLDACTEGSIPGVKVQFWEDTNHTLVIDSHVEPVTPFVKGAIYKIVNVQSGTVAHLESNGNGSANTGFRPAPVRGYEYNEGRNQFAHLGEQICSGILHSRLLALDCSGLFALDALNYMLWTALDCLLWMLWTTCSGLFALDALDYML
ncbi:hypothetical protein FA15DRAFT_659421 [Coprinopsis marcescibilis]|uniref:Ricin B lectin domain-containing protein n=1 Tax=Coprinopsis marcescibilis TaxID=230819 RepID=A0A5C3KIM9_COPMA|nr:hypothetical protein FA15DRAFT_659421 [Coprinopsis marcescibilis]